MFPWKNQAMTGLSNMTEFRVCFVIFIVAESRKKQSSHVINLYIVHKLFCDLV